MALVLHAPAKLNLYLAVLGRRPDGYHEVETILHEIALHDTLVAEQGGAAGAIELRVAAGAGSGLPVAGDRDNLVWRAADRFFAGLADRAAPACGVRFHLTKRIPAGGGLGGGSSDAAAALLLLNALWDRPLDDGGLHRIAAGLGADVPFFLRGGTQFGRGTGTELTVLDDDLRFRFVLLLPPIGTATAAIYKNHAPHLTHGATRTSIPSDKVPAVKEIAVATGFPNDLEASALALHPQLANLRDRVVALGYPQVRMSGSGSTFFVACESAAESDTVRHALAPLEQDGVTLLQTSSSHAARQPVSGSFPGGY